MSSDISLEGLSVLSPVGDTTGTILVAQIRRLKIQENLLTKNVNKDTHCDSVACVNTNDGIINKLDSKTFISKLIALYSEVSDLFLALKSNITIEENLEEIDLNEVKSEVLTLDSKIKLLKTLIEDDFQSLKLNEKELEKQIGEKNLVIEQLKALPRMKIKTYNDSVPSPTKAIIQSPYKCQAVQRFQDFMKESQNRNGGWNEYNHNVFVRIWNKFYHSKDVYQSDFSTSFIDDETFHLFSNEVSNKISGLKLQSIVTHSQWYARFRYLKDEQQRAIDRWRHNQSKINNNRQGKIKRQGNGFERQKNTNKTFNTSLTNSFDSGRSSNSSMSITNNHEPISSSTDFEQSRFLQEDSSDVVENNFRKTETKEQFLIRMSQPKMEGFRKNPDIDCFNFQYRTLENIPKVHVPLWRQGLKQIHDNN